MLRLVVCASWGLRYPAGHGHVEITLGSKAIMLSADEEGFSAADVRAVCAIGKSTKKRSANQTGRKGESGKRQPRGGSAELLGLSFTADIGC